MPDDQAQLAALAAALAAHLKVKVLKWRVVRRSRLTAAIGRAECARLGASDWLDADGTQAKPLKEASRFSLAAVLDGSVTLAPCQRLFSGEPHRPVIGIAANYEALTLSFLHASLLELEGWRAI